ncbi:MAG: zinc ribbon domain-containing protein [Gemmatimonadales bacterium]
MDLQKCRRCGSIVASSATTCPQCGTRLVSDRARVLVLVAAFALLLFGLYTVLT